MTKSSRRQILWRLAQRLSREAKREAMQSMPNERFIEEAQAVLAVLAEMDSAGAAPLPGAGNGERAES